jgi:hypothetical protein
MIVQKGLLVMDRLAIEPLTGVWGNARSASVGITRHRIVVVQDGDEG